MTEIVLRRRRRLPRLRRRVQRVAPLLVGVVGLGWALVAVDEPSSDVMVRVPTAPTAPAPVVPVPVVPPEEPIEMRDEDRPAPTREPVSTAAEVLPVSADTSTASDVGLPADTTAPTGAGGADLAPDRPGPVPPGAPAPPGPPDPPDRPDPPEPPEQPEQPDLVRDLVDDVTDLTPLTESVGDVVLDLLDPHAS